MHAGGRDGGETGADVFRVDSGQARLEMEQQVGELVLRAVIHGARS